MQTHIHDRFKRVVINPGEFYAAKGAVTISTLLGSCVAACLFDPVNQVIGMNHFLLSTTHELQDQYSSEAGRYGINAMELLINEMLTIGAERKFLKAKAFGGASICRDKGDKDGFLPVGKVNCIFIRQFLDRENIPLIAESLGGGVGRVIHFTNGDFSVYARKIVPSRSGRVAERDYSCWLKAIEIQEKSIPNVDIWD